MKQLLNRSSFAAVISTAVISFTTFYLDDGSVVRNAIQMAAPLTSQGIVVLAIWLFFFVGFDTIEGMRERQIKAKLRADLEYEVGILDASIKSGNLSPQDEAKKREEYSAKITELTNIKVKIPRN